jgi:tRNA A-37 threonylcarbamoyl transferase component Bud32
MAKSFEIQDQESGQSLQLQCDTLLREISGRRQVWRGTCDGQPAIVKIFQSSLHRKRHLTRESNGIKELHKRNLPAPQLLGYGPCDKDNRILVLELIKNARDVVEIQKQQQDNLTPVPIYKAVMAYCADMHRTGVTQKDLHLGNFLWDGSAIYAIDPAEMRFQSNPVSRQQCLNQISLLLKNALSYPNEIFSEILNAYCQQQQWNLSDPLVEQVKERVHNKRIKTVERSLKKTLRSATAFVKTRDNSGSMGVFVRDVFHGIDLQVFMEQVDRTIEAGHILKDGDTCFVSKILVNDLPVVVKRYNHKSWWHSFRHTLKGSRARKSWLFAHRLCGVKLPTAKPVAFIEQRRFGLIWKSYIITEFVQGPSLLQFLRKSDDKRLESDVIQSTDLLLRKLARNHMIHGDVKTTNFLIRNNKPVLIDLDSMHRHRIPQILKFYCDKMINTFHQRLYTRPPVKRA